MYTSVQKDKIEKICKAMLEMAKGRFFYRIKCSDQSDLLDRAIMHTNMFAEEFRENLHHSAVVNPHETYKHIAQMTFLLDGGFRIHNFNSTVPEVLSIEKGELKGLLFADLLTKKSYRDWKDECVKIGNFHGHYSNTLRLSLWSNNSLEIPSLCTISSLMFKRDRGSFYTLTALQTVIQSRENEKKYRQSILSDGQKERDQKKKNVHKLTRQSDKRKIQEVYDFILNHLDKPLPKLKVLAHDRGTNEFKLKIGFKQLFNNTVFRFQREQRLKRAHSFIAGSELLLSEISDICGFKSYSHFSKCFKEEYGYNPSTLQKKYRTIRNNN